jgi:hypothetical protein
MNLNLVEEKNHLARQHDGDLANWEDKSTTVYTAISPQSASDSVESACFSKRDADHISRSSFGKNLVQSGILTPNRGSFTTAKRLGSSNNERYHGERLATWG